MCFKKYFVCWNVQVLTKYKRVGTGLENWFLAVQRSGSLPLVLHHKLVDLALKDKIPIAKNYGACFLKLRLYNTYLLFSRHFFTCSQRFYPAKEYCNTK